MPVPVEHQFCQCTHSRILLDLIIVQHNSFMVIVVVDVLLPLFFRRDPFWPTASLLFEFQKGVDILCKQSTSLRVRVILRSLLEMPYFVYIHHYVAKWSCFCNFHRRPCSGQRSIRIIMVAWSLLSIFCTHTLHNVNINLLFSFNGRSGRSRPFGGSILHFTNPS